MNERNNSLAEALAERPESEMRAWVIEEIRGPGQTLEAVKICSALLEDHINLVFASELDPFEDLVVYRPEELEVLAKKSPAEVLKIHRIKGPEVQK